MPNYLNARTPILVLLIATFSIGYTMAHNKAVVIPLGGADIPGGAIMAFNRASCPSGWTYASATRGRTIVGLSSGGTLGGITPNTLAFSDLENRRHSHIWALYFGANKNWNTFNAIGSTRTLIQWSNGIGNEGVGFYPIALAQSTSNDTFHTNQRSGFIPYVQYIYCEKN